MLLWNNVTWLVKRSHMTWNNQSEIFITCLWHWLRRVYFSILFLWRFLKHWGGNFWVWHEYWKMVFCSKKASVSKTKQIFTGLGFLENAYIEQKKTIWMNTKESIFPQLAVLQYLPTHPAAIFLRSKVWIWSLIIFPSVFRKFFKKYLACLPTYLAFHSF